MKKFIVLASLIITSMTYGQERHPERKASHKKGKMELMKDLSTEQIATLKTKKMTLAFDLSKSQQNQVYTLLLEETTSQDAQRKERQKESSNSKLTPEEKFNKMNSRLDKKIIHKAKLKEILSKEQFEKWEATSRKRMHQKRKPH